MLVNKKTIIFITIYPFNEDYAIKYGFDILKKRGFDIVILNVLNFIYPKAVEKLPGYTILVPVCGVEQVCVKSRKDLENHLNNITGWKLAILVVIPCIKLLKVLRYASVNYIILFLNIQPSFPKKRADFLKRLFFLLIHFFKKPVDVFLISILPRLPYRLVGVHYPKYVVLGSEITNCSYSLLKTQAIYSHSFDYDRYLRNKNKPKPEFVPDDYYVHIADTPWGGHDYFIIDYKPRIRKSEYSRIINAFFDFVEKKTSKKIIIAAHPKHSDEDNIYHGRPFLYDTEQLIKYSSGVMCHFSGAIKFAIIHKKPICFISSRRFEKDTYFQSNISAYSRGFGAKINYIDNEADWLEVLDKGFFYNKEAYEDYERKYIKAIQTEDRLLWDTVADALIDGN